jgi:hypothetical protein
MEIIAIIDYEQYRLLVCERCHGTARTQHFIGALHEPEQGDEKAVEGLVVYGIDGEPVEYEARAYPQLGMGKIKALACAPELFSW